MIVPLRRSLFVFVPLALIACLVSPAAAAAEEAVLLEGVDVSHHQGEIDWDAVAATGKGFVYAKATEGIDFTDPLFGTYWDGIAEAGMLRGAYHFFIPADDGQQQAEFFLATVPLDEMDLPPVLDVEERGGVSKDDLLAGVVAWLEAVEAATGRLPVIYTDRNFWNALEAAGECSRYPLWIAEYGVDEPQLPDDWDRWTLWQHTEKGTVDGLAKPVDLSRFRGDLDDLRALGLPAAVEADVESDAPRELDETDLGSP